MTWDLMVQELGFTFTDLGCKVAGIGDDLKGKGQELGMI